MPVPSAAVLANRIRDTWITLSPTGFGALSSADRAAITSSLLTAIATEVRAVLLTDMVITVSGTTASACAAGGAAGTCTGSGTVS